MLLSRNFVVIAQAPTLLRQPKVFFWEVFRDFGGFLERAHRHKLKKIAGTPAGGCAGDFLLITTEKLTRRGHFCRDTWDTRPSSGFSEIFCVFFLCALFAPYLCAKANSPSFSQNSTRLPQNSVSSVFRNSTLETVFCLFHKELKKDVSVSFFDWDHNCQVQAPNSSVPPKLIGKEQVPSWPRLLQRIFSKIIYRGH